MFQQRQRSAHVYGSRPRPYPHPPAGSKVKGSSREAHSRGLSVWKTGPSSRKLVWSLFKYEYELRVIIYYLIIYLFLLSQPINLTGCGPADALGRDPSLWYIGVCLSALPSFSSGLWYFNKTALIVAKTVMKTAGNATRVVVTCPRLRLCWSRGAIYTQTGPPATCSACT